MDALHYKIPFHFERATYQGKGTVSQIINVESLRTFTASLLKAGGCFVSKTSLAAPFGPGWIPNTNCP
jgi:hypothetical protein